MAYLNKVLMMGNLTRDPEMRVTPKGTAICSFGIALNNKWKAEDGTEREEAIFVDIEAWGKVAEVISKYFTKGKAIFVEGRLKFDQWEDKATNQKRSKLKVVLERFEFIGGRDAEANGQHSPDERAAPAGHGSKTQAPAQRQAPRETVDEDVPF